MSSSLSPAAQAARFAYGNCIGGVDAVMGSEWRGLAAALRAVADHAPNGRPKDRWISAREIFAIAAELEANR